MQYTRTREHGSLLTEIVLFATLLFILGTIIVRNSMAVKNVRDSIFLTKIHIECLNRLDYLKKLCLNPSTPLPYRREETATIEHAEVRFREKCNLSGSLVFVSVTATVEGKEVDEVSCVVKI